MKQIELSCNCNSHRCDTALTIEVIELLGNEKRVLLAITGMNRGRRTMQSIELDRNNLSELVYRLQQIKHWEMRGE